MSLGTPTPCSASRKNAISKKQNKTTGRAVIKLTYGIYNTPTGCFLEIQYTNKKCRDRVMIPMHFNPKIRLYNNLYINLKK